VKISTPLTVLVPWVYTSFDFSTFFIFKLQACTEWMGKMHNAACTTAVVTVSDDFFDEYASSLLRWSGNKCCKLSLLLFCKKNQYFILMNSGT